jgi:hypothetical protein
MPLATIAMPATAARAISEATSTYSTVSAPLSDATALLIFNPSLRIGSFMRILLAFRLVPLHIVNTGERLTPSMPLSAMDC